MIRCTIFYINIVRASCAAVEKRGSCRRHTCRRRPADDLRTAAANTPVRAPSTIRPLRAPNRPNRPRPSSPGFTRVLFVFYASGTPCERPDRPVLLAPRPRVVFAFSGAHRCAERSAAGRISHPSNQFRASPPHRTTPQYRDLGD